MQPSLSAICSALFVLIAVWDGWRLKTYGMPPLAIVSFLSAWLIALIGPFTNQSHLFPGSRAELVQFGVDVIFAIGPPQALAAAKATNRIPIVFVGGGDPVAMGLIKSFAQPGGNLTGLTFVTVELASKRGFSCPHRSRRGYTLWALTFRRRRPKPRPLHIG